MTIAHTIATHPCAAAIVGLGALAGVFGRIGIIAERVRAAFPAIEESRATGPSGWRGRRAAE